MEAQLVTVKTTEGTEVIAAYVDGPLMAHMTIGGPMWSISHGETGWRVVPVGVSKEKAFGMLPDLIGSADWSGIQTDESGQPVFKIERKVFAEAVRNVCARHGVDLT